jgi:hypothetical protein
LKDNGEFAK